MVKGFLYVLIFCNFIFIGCSNNSKNNTFKNLTKEEIEIEKSIEDIDEAMKDLNKAMFKIRKENENN